MFKMLARSCIPIAKFEHIYQGYSSIHLFMVWKQTNTWGKHKGIPNEYKCFEKNSLRKMLTTILKPAKVQDWTYWKYMCANNTISKWFWKCLKSSFTVFIQAQRHFSYGTITNIRNSFLNIYVMCIFGSCRSHNCGSFRKGLVGGRF
jgi:hypothetical protein